ncbi:hypothetical protein BD769DRAFT_1370290, partial [Suillus cothurnatus]
VSQPWFELDVEKHKALLLTSLKIEPAPFSSAQNREIAFTPEILPQRLSSRAHWSHLKDKGSISKTRVGMISALRPSESIYHMLELFERAGLGADLNIYFVAGLWVRPEHRRRGLGMHIVKEGLELVRTNMDLKNR